ncbi:MAG: M24 family metallopeptidase [Aestuariivita sp.]
MREALFRASINPMESQSIPVEEFSDRRARAAAAAQAHGLDGLVICSRGGGTLDRYGDVQYLTNYVTSFPFIPDLPGQWAGRAHAFVVLRADGAARLIADAPDDATAAIDAQDIRPAEDVLACVAEALRELGLAHGRLGLVGSDVLSVAHERALRGHVPGAHWQEAQEILVNLRAIKSPAELDQLRHASAIGSRTLEAMMQVAEPGVSHGEVVAAGMGVLAPAGGALYNSFMASGRGGVEAYAHRRNFPTWGTSAPLAEGEWFRIGISGAVGGYVFDHSRSKAIGAPSNRQIALFEDAMAIVEAAIAAIRPGVQAQDIAAAGLAEQAARGYPNDGVFSGLGHGIGLGWDAPWLAPGDTTLLEPGMVLSVERTIRKDGYLGDYEDSVIVTDTGTERISHAQKRWW